MVRIKALGRIALLLPILTSACQLAPTEQNTGVLDPLVERSVVLGVQSSPEAPAESLSAFGTVEFVRFKAINAGSDRIPITSRVIARIRTANGASVKPSAVDHIVLGIRANDQFRAIVADPDLWTASTGPLLQRLDRSDRTFVMLWARGYRLASDQDFLQLDPDFEPGKPIELDLIVETTGGLLASSNLSIAGTHKELPPFNTGNSDDTDELADND